MALLAYLFEIGILLTCFISVGLTSFWILPRIPIALHACFAPFLLIMCLFCLEHYFPLGQLPFLWLPVVGWTLFLLRYRPDLIKQLRDPVYLFLCIGFGICFFWRYSFPDIWHISEQMADLDHLMSWSDGKQLPAPDRFAVGELDTSYYILQYYAAGLIHRFIGTSPGLTYHLGYSMLVAVGVAGFGSGVQAATRSVWAGLLAVLWICLGGNGTTLVTPFMTWQVPDPLFAMRFIGSFAEPSNSVLTTKGQEIVQFLGVSPVEAPMEYFSYVIWLGDFHPSISSMVFLGLAILAIGAAERAEANRLADRACVAAAISTAVLIVITNTWITPLQSCLVGAWLVYRWLAGRRDSFSLIAGSVLVPFTLMFPFFAHFALDSRHYPAKLEFVKELPPILNWAAVMWPALLMVIGTFVTLIPIAKAGVQNEVISAKESVIRPSSLWAFLWEQIDWLRATFLNWIGVERLFAVFILVTGFGSLECTYYLYIHDIYGANEAIFNTALKWWPWAYALAVIGGLICMWRADNQTFVLRLIVVLILGSTISANTTIYAYDWWRKFYFAWPGPGRVSHVGQMEGYGWLSENTFDASTLQMLTTLPHGVVLESRMPDAADTGAAIALYTGHSQVGAWTYHEQLWRGDRPDLGDIAAKRDLFYSGNLPNPIPWLNAAAPGGVDYIVWLQRDNDVARTSWPAINESLKSEYDWRQSFTDNASYFGIWVRRH